MIDVFIVAWYVVAIITAFALAMNPIFHKIERVFVIGELVCALLAVVWPLVWIAMGCRACVHWRDCFRQRLRFPRATARRKNIP